MKLKPLADRVVLKQRAAEERTASGLFLASSAQEKPEIYDVIEVGPGGLVDGNPVEMIVKAGQQVLVGSTAAARSSWKTWSTPSCASPTSWPSSSN